MHRPLEEVFEILLDGDEIKEVATWLEFDEEVEIALWTRCAARERAKYPHPCCAVLLGDPDDLAAHFLHQRIDLHSLAPVPTDNWHVTRTMPVWPHDDCQYALNAT